MGAAFFQERCLDAPRWSAGPCMCEMTHCILAKGSSSLSWHCHLQRFFPTQCVPHCPQSCRMVSRTIESMRSRMRTPSSLMPECLYSLVIH